MTQCDYNNTELKMISSLKVRKNKFTVFGDSIGNDMYYYDVVMRVLVLLQVLARAKEER